MTFVRMTALAMALMLFGCAQDTTGPDSGTSGSLVRLTASGGSTLGSIRLGKLAGVDQTLASVDSLVITHAIIVLKDVKFLLAPDSVHMRDSTECQRDDDAEDRGEGKGDPALHFKGPFIVVLHDSTPVQIALDTLAAGLYSGIKFNIHKLRSRDVNRNPSFPDSLLGYSVAVAGFAKYSAGGWAPFVFKADINEDFKAKGDFVVAAGQTLTPYVLKFDLVSWFRSASGRLLDPNDLEDRRGIRHAIKASLKGRMAGGRDRDNDGHPDVDMWDGRDIGS